MVEELVKLIYHMLVGGFAGLVWITREEAS